MNKGKMKIRESEFRAYNYIKEQLKLLGWDIRNPSRNPEGEVYTQQECLDNSEIKKGLGKNRPENVIKLSERFYWIIEAKSEHSKLQQALNEAQDYAESINNNSKEISVVFASGVAGNDSESYLTSSRFFDGKKWLPILINSKEISGLLNKNLTLEILRTKNPEIKDLPIDEELFLQKAEKINQILHLGAINKNYRARVIAALLLSLIAKTQPNIDSEPTVLIKEINDRVEYVLTEQNKENFTNFITLSLPPTKDNHIKFKKALVETIQELNNLNIRSAMNSGTDVLGKFYEVFLKYGNGAKEIGIVLTPRHITKFAVEVLNINEKDIIFDPTCGTGGFLVATFDYVKSKASESEINRFKQYNLFGIEQEPEVVALAIVNMIFRGDGKNNIDEGNCFVKNYCFKTKNGHPTAEQCKTKQEGFEAITKVLMNPPFALKTSDEKEFKFIDYALSQMKDDGILFSVLPSSQLVRQGVYLLWRKKLLENNTLLSVITFPEDLFYPVGVYTCGIFIKKGIPHDKNKKVLWIRALNDGLLKSKGKRLPNIRAKNDYKIIKPTLKSFINNQDMKIESVPEFIKLTKIDFLDETLELAPEAYLDEKEPDEKDIKKRIEQSIRDSAAFIIKSGMEDEL